MYGILGCSTPWPALFHLFIPATRGGVQQPHCGFTSRFSDREEKHLNAPKRQRDRIHHTEQWGKGLSTGSQTEPFCFPQPRGPLAMSGCHNLAVPRASGGWRPGMLPKTLQCTGQPPWAKNYRDQNGSNAAAKEPLSKRTVVRIIPLSHVIKVIDGRYSSRGQFPAVFNFLKLKEQKDKGYLLRAGRGAWHMAEARFSQVSCFLLNPHNNAGRYFHHFINEETYQAEKLVQTHTKRVELGSEAVIFHSTQGLTFNQK